MTPRAARRSHPCSPGPRSLPLALALLALSGCTRPAASEPRAIATAPRPATTTATPAPRPAPALPPPAPLPPTTRPSAARIVAVGDLHGDLEAARAVFRLAGALDAQDHWSGGTLVLVQTGDLLDRGDQDRALLDWSERLAGEAHRAGGALVLLNGNHEIMNVQGDFRYVTRRAFADFDGVVARGAASALAAELPPEARGRGAAFFPGGPYARLLASRNTVTVVGETAFVHGGLLPEHVSFGLDAINRAVRDFMLGTRPALPAVLAGEESPVWLRQFALADDAETCALLGRTLGAAHVRRLVVGHTVQRTGITPACDGRVWRIDVGLSRYYGGPTQALEITGDRVRVLDARAPN